jgi:hypothetical protein
MVNSSDVYDTFHKKYYSLICGISQDPDTENYLIVSQDEYCGKCSKQYTNICNKLCYSCQMHYFTIKTSGNKKIDDFIQEVQLMQLKNYHFNNKIVEWISYNQFINIKETAKDNDNATVIYSAIWKNGPLYYYGGNKWIRDSYKNVVLKCLTLDTDEFLSEV